MHDIRFFAGDLLIETKNGAASTPNALANNQINLQRNELNNDLKAFLDNYCKSDESEKLSNETKSLENSLDKFYERAKQLGCLQQFYGSLQTAYTNLYNYKSYYIKEYLWAYACAIDAISDPLSKLIEKYFPQASLFNIHLAWCLQADVRDVVKLNYALQKLQAIENLSKGEKFLLRDYIQACDGFDKAKPYLLSLLTKPTLEKVIKSIQKDIAEITAPPNNLLEVIPENETPAAENELENEVPNCCTLS